MTGLSVAVVAAGAVLGVGTFLIRLSGPALARRLRISERGSQLVDAAAVVILFAVMTTSALTDGHRFSDLARPIGVLVGVVLAYRRAPLVVVILAAALTTAALRQAGL